MSRVELALRKAQLWFDLAHRKRPHEQQAEEILVLLLAIRFAEESATKLFSDVAELEEANAAN